MKTFYHKTDRNSPIIVADDAQISDWPDYIETQPDLPLSNEEIAELDIMMRRMRDAELARTDHLMLSDMNPTQEIIDYRQALRDAPQHPNWPLETPDITFKGNPNKNDRILDGEYP